MMNSRELVKAALRFEHVDRVPIDVDESSIPAFRSDIIAPKYRYGAGKSSGRGGVRGTYTDSWGCVWECGESGVKGEVKHPMIEDWDMLGRLELPFEILDGVNINEVNEAYAATDRFVMRGWSIELFQRMQYLRGTENLFIDLALEDENVMLLRDKVHSFYKAEVQLWAETDIDAIHIEDDWGAQNAMLISPNMWRKLFKPLYKEYCDIAKSHGKLVVMHSDGYILDIIPDLIEIGVNAINPQLGIMDDVRLAAAMRGKIALWGGIDRQWTLPFGTEDDCVKAVHQVMDLFFVNGASGVIGHCFRDKDGKYENVCAVYREWSRYRPIGG